ncbi:MAG: polysaccharide deacetylase family protein [Bacteroidota bacterium]|nr:polysaccharide deacetylase family protein [Bacteroidota bacterium]
MKSRNQSILLTFDVEEFDLPADYGIKITEQEQMAVGKKGLDAINELLDDRATPCTLFTTANFALKYPSEIAALSLDHEIASHTFFHSSFKREDLKNSRQVLEDITSKKITGMRMPRMKKIEAGWVREAGYSYDSSVNPTWIPGRYNNYRMPRTCFMENGIMRVPASVSANFRIPLFWLAFKNLPYSYFKRLALQALRKDGHLVLYFHPWEFVDLEHYNIPTIIKRKSGSALLAKLKKLISDLKEVGNFTTVQSFIENR